MASLSLQRTQQKSCSGLESMEKQAKPGGNSAETPIHFAGGTDWFCDFPGRQHGTGFLDDRGDVLGYPRFCPDRAVAGTVFDTSDYVCAAIWACGQHTGSADGLPQSGAADRKCICVSSGAELCGGADTSVGGHSAFIGGVLCALYLFPVLRWENAGEKIRIRPVCGSYCRSLHFACGSDALAGGKCGWNEQLAPLPELREEDGSFNVNILNEFSDYFADHFGFRHEMITLNDQLTGAAFKTLDSSSVLLGKNGWLFYKSTLEDYTGAKLFTARQSYAAARVLGLMQEYCKQNGVDFYFTIAPNKNSIYGSQMPARYAAASKRNAQLLEQQMQKQNVRYIDLFEVLSDSQEQLYYHWTVIGICGAHRRRHRSC